MAPIAISTPVPGTPPEQGVPITYGRHVRSRTVTGGPRPERQGSERSRERMRLFADRGRMTPRGSATSRATLPMQGFAPLPPPLEQAPPGLPGQSGPAIPPAYPVQTGFHQGCGCCSGNARWGWMPQQGAGNFTQPQTPFGNTGFDPTMWQRFQDWMNNHGAGNVGFAQGAGGERPGISRVVLQEKEFRRVGKFSGDPIQFRGWVFDL